MGQMWLIKWILTMKLTVQRLAQTGSTQNEAKMTSAETSDLSNRLEGALPFSEIIRL